MLLANVLNEPTFHPIKKCYERWYTFMEEKVEFWLPDSEWHTKTHSARVLLHALIIGYQKGIRDEGLDALGMAAVFHDTRRLDDGIDQGHGSRGAAYYKEYCDANDELPYDEKTYLMIYYHDQHDSLGLSEIEISSNDHEKAKLLYQIFKDADALDRFRLGPNGLDVNFLRTEEARRLVEFAKHLLRQSEETKI